MENCHLEGNLVALVSTAVLRLKVITTVAFPFRLKLKGAIMKDPSRRSTSPNIINEDVIMNGHSHDDDNPFAEYMWMENEEEFNRQVSELTYSLSCTCNDGVLPLCCKYSLKFIRLKRAKIPPSCVFILSLGDLKSATLSATQFCMLVWLAYVALCSEW